METTCHNNRDRSALQNVHSVCRFAPEKQLRGVYFGVESIPLAILQINLKNGIDCLSGKGESPPFKREREGFCKEKEKLFATVWGGPPLSKSINISKQRENLSDFAGFVVPAFSSTDGRCVW